MARNRKHRSLGEMISSICFYAVGVYFLLEGSLARDGGEPSTPILACGAPGIACVMGGARFIIAEIVEKAAGEAGMAQINRTALNADITSSRTSQSTPYGCRRFGFKGPFLPSRMVFQETGMKCAYYEVGAPEKRGAGQPDLTGDWHDHRVQCGAGKHQDCP